MRLIFLTVLMGFSLLFPEMVIASDSTAPVAKVKSKAAIKEKIQEKKAETSPVIPLPKQMMDPLTYANMLVDLKNLIIRDTERDQKESKLSAKERAILFQEDLIAFGVILLRICVILLIFVGLWRLTNRFINFYSNHVHIQHEHHHTTSNAVLHTIMPIIRSILRWFLVVLTSLLILSELNINIMPIVYSFSVIGLAISFGAQTLVKDLINGILTLFEGNMAIGDMVTIDQNTGVVETISLRCVHLRHDNGELQTIPFSEVKFIANHSRDFTGAIIKIRVAYDAKIQDVENVIKQSFEIMKKDYHFGAMITGPLQISIPAEQSGLYVEVVASVKLSPDPTKSFANEFYRLVFLGLQENKIPFPTPITAPISNLKT